MRLVVVSGAVGQLVRLFAVAFVAPLLLAAFDGAWASAAHFGGAALASVALGSLLARGYRAPRLIHRSEAMAVVAFTWLTVAAVASLPYLLAGLGPIDAFFESMSGLTTTGATVLVDFSAYDRSFFLWRAITQWLGGVGVIALFIVVLPRLGIAGRELFFAEASTAPGEDISPQVRKSASKVWLLYLGLTMCCILALKLAGMTLYEAVVHAFTTLSAGGFSPHPRSVAGYGNPAAEWVLVVFMVLGGASFPLQVRALTGRPGVLLKDEELLAYLGVMVLAVLALALVLAGGVPDPAGLRTSAFQVASLMSSTGFASTDYNLWGDTARVVLVLVMLVGGCAGSAAGGPKVVRLLLVARHVARELRQTLHPRAVLSIRYKGQGVSTAVVRAVFTLVALYAVGYVVLGVALTFTGLDLVASFTAAIACLGNVGPGLGLVGPMGSYASLPVGAKVLCTLAMWIGRLEIVTVLALLHPDVLRTVRVGDLAPRRLGRNGTTF